jgi:polysaccharide biosynthesis transport protein
MPMQNEVMTGNGLLGGDLNQLLADGLSARALLASIRRHLGIVVAFTLSLCAAGALIGLGLPAWYQAEGVLVIHARPQRLAELQELPDPALDASVIQSEVDILQSRSVIEPVVRSLRLWEAPEFQKMEYPKGWNWEIVEARLGEIWRGVRDMWTSEGDSEKNKVGAQPTVSSQPDDANPPTQAQIDGAVGTYSRYLGAGNDGHSNTIRVSYQAWTAERAAAIVNAHMDSYRNLEVQAKVAAAEHANSALRAQVEDLRQKLQTAEVAITNYRVQHHLTGAARDNGGVSQQLAALTGQLITAQADSAESQARAARIGAGAGPDSLPEVVNSGTISGLRGQEAQLAAREADLSKYHGDEYPDLRRVRASLENLRGQISREIGRDRAAALQLVERSRAREQSLQQSITELTKQLNTADAGLQQLQGNAESVRSLLLNLEKRVAETAANPAFIGPNSTIASHANALAASTSPKAKELAFAGGFVGFTLGSLLSVLLELRDKGFRTSAQVQGQIRSLTVSATPRALGRGRKSPADTILNDPRSAFAEALRVSWAKIHLAVAGPRSISLRAAAPPVALGITSAAKGEGKSVHALALARTAALAGENVVLVDADLRRAGVSRLVRQDFSFTLIDYLYERCTADEAIVVEESSGAYFVPGAPSDIAWTTQQLQRFFNFIEYLKHRYGIVIIDLPPVVGLAETIRLGLAADHIAMVIRWGRTERQLVQFALDALRGANLSTIAVILNDIDLKSQRRRGYRDHSSVIYSDRELYRPAPGYQEPAPRAPLPMIVAKPDSPEAHRHRSSPAASDIENPAASDIENPAASDIEKLYGRYYRGTAGAARDGSI